MMHGQVAALNACLYRILLAVDVKLRRVARIDLAVRAFSLSL